MYMQKLTPQAPQAEQQPTGEFAAVRRDILQMQQNWDTFYKEFSQLKSPYAGEFKQHNQNFLRAVNTILTALETPTLTLATTGTTSSGKSTLVNLLCGADIMPRMAGEMSAGIVTIKHASDGKRLLKIEKTASATWECGEWKDLSDDDIRERLTNTMDAFNKAKQERELPSPIIDLSYPIACFSSHTSMLDLSDLPSHTQFQIMDLPGKRNQDDKINSAVIQNCRRTLSIVTYDMAQTDEKLRQSLMEEVLEQVKLMGGSPARILFTLNRIDVFRKDDHWERREQEAAEKTIKEIKGILHDRLPEHRNVLEHLSYSKLSSLPALLAWQMQSSEGDQRNNSATDLYNNFGNMIPDRIRDDLWRNAAKWEENDFQNVQDAIWESSYANDFFPVLEKHIRENFAKLIIAPLLVEFEGVVSPIIGQADRTCMDTDESSKKKLNEVKGKLEAVYTSLTGQLISYHDELTMQKQTPTAPQKTVEFAAVRSDILQMQQNWDTFYKEFSQLKSPYAGEFKQHNQDVSKAVKTILTALETPTLTLATTGTTSSGKSTLVNLLCGADIMPRMAGEMSAGIVTIKHASDGKRLLKIEQTTDAAWECGEWKDLSDYDIRNRLKKTMKAFNETKEKCELPSPIIELTYPIACFLPNAEMLNLSDLPNCTQFQIMDLPGKRNQDDKVNSAVIQNCRRALSIVTYDMGQTDEKLRQSLMEEVLEQVKLMGGSPARMLFTLNRIDVFRKDHDWEQDEQDAVKKTINEIKQILHDRLPEHRDALEHLSHSKLSSLPALYAWQMKVSQGEQRATAAEEIDESFGKMIPKPIKKDLPRSTESWEESEFKKVQDAVWESSYANDFFPVLEKHIHENFAKLIVAPLLIEFEDVVEDIIIKAKNICVVEVSSSKEKLEDILEQLNKDYETITAALQHDYKDLTGLPEFISASLTNLDSLYNESEKNTSDFDMNSIYNTPLIKKSILPALSKVTIEPITKLGDISEILRKSLKAGNINFTGTKVDNLSFPQKKSLSAIYQDLVKFGYDTEAAKNGNQVKLITDKENDYIHEIINVFKNNMSSISSLMQDVYEDQMKKEDQRIQELMGSIVTVFLEKLNCTIKEQGLMITVKFTEKNHKNTKLDLPSIRFSLVPSHVIKSEANPWRLWFTDRKVSYIAFPSADELHDRITKHLTSIKKNSAEPLAMAIDKYFIKINKDMSDHINKIMKEVHANLEKTSEQHKTKNNDHEKRWGNLCALIEPVASSIDQLSIYKA